MLCARRPGGCVVRLRQNREVPTFAFRVAETAVLSWARGVFGEGDEVADRVARRPWGYTVSPQSRAFLDSGDPMTMIVGSGPYVVDGESGEVWRTRSSPGEYHGDGTRPGYGGLDDVDAFLVWRRGRSPGIANVLDEVDPASSDERRIERFARWQNLLLPYTGAGEFGWSDMEIGLLVRPAADAWALAKWDRGPTTDLAVFSHRDDAIRMFLIELASTGFRHEIVPRVPPAGVEFTEIDGRPGLRWDDREARFLQRGVVRRTSFVPFVRAPLEDIEESFRSPSGMPLLRYDPL